MRVRVGQVVYTHMKQFVICRVDRDQLALQVGRKLADLHPGLAANAATSSQ